MKFIVFGKVPSKSNSYKIIKKGGFSSLAKTKNLIEYEKQFFAQVPADYRGHSLDVPMSIKAAIYWETLRQDLDNSAKILLDCLQQSKVIKNDNLVYELHLSKHMDKAHPRAEISIIPIMEDTEQKQPELEF